MASWLLSPTLPRLNAVVERYERLPLDDVFELFDRCSRVLVMTSPSFDFRAPQLPQNVTYVGPQLDDPDWAAETKWERQGSSEPLVLVATSSIYQDQIALLRRIAQAVGQLPVGAVLTAGRCRSGGDSGRSDCPGVTGCPAHPGAPTKPPSSSRTLDMAPC